MRNINYFKMTGSAGNKDRGPSLSDLTRVHLTNLDKVMYPVVSVTKQDVITYYIRMAPRILPFLHNRPLTMHRFPGGVGGEAFYEKDAPQGTPDYVEIFTHPDRTADREVRYVLCNNLDTLIWLANLASLELHATLSAAVSYDSPDLLLFDIDPEPPLTFDDVIDVARIVHEQLENEVGIQSFVKTSGKKGLHIVVPLMPADTRSKRSGHLPILWEKKLHGTLLSWLLGVRPFAGPRDNLRRLSPECPREKPWLHRTASGLLPVQRFLPRSAGRSSGTGYIPKILIYGQCFLEVKTHGGASLTPGRQSEDKAALRSPRGRAIKDIQMKAANPDLSIHRKYRVLRQKKDQPTTLVIPKHPPDEPEQKGNAGRPFWSGSITIGLVNVPVRLHTMVRDRSFSFRLLHRDDGQPLRYDRVCTKDGRVVPWADTVKGYEVRKGRIRGL